MNRMPILFSGNHEYYVQNTRYPIILSRQLESQAKRMKKIEAKATLERKRVAHMRLT